MTPPILDWVPLLVSCLNSATGAIESFTIGEVKNLQVLVSIKLTEPFNKKNEPYVRSLIKAFAEANSCKIKWINFNNNELLTQLFLKYPHGPSQYNDPIL